MTDKEFIKARQAYVLYHHKKSQIEKSIRQKEKSLMTLEGKKEQIEKDLHALKIEDNMSFNPPCPIEDNVYFYAGCVMTYGDDKEEVLLSHRVGKPIRKTNDLLYFIKTYHTDSLRCKYYSLSDNYIISLEKNLFWPRGSISERANMFIDEFNAKVLAFEYASLIVSNNSDDNFAFSYEEYEKICGEYYDYLFKQKEYDAPLALKRVAQRYPIDIHNKKI